MTDRSQEPTGETSGSDVTDSGVREALERSAGLIDILERNIPEVDPATWIEARSDIAKIRSALRAAAPVERPLDGEALDLEVALLMRFEQLWADHAEASLEKLWGEVHAYLNGSADHPTVRRLRASLPGDIVKRFQCILNEARANASQNPAALAEIDNDARIVRRALSRTPTSEEGEKWYISAEWYKGDDRRQLALTDIPFDEHDEVVRVMRAIHPTSGDAKP